MMTFTEDQPSKIYVENTSRCNLHCKMCLLNELDEPTGLMPLPRFTALIDQLREFPKMPIIHFAGYGEPTSHPHFLEMLTYAKSAGAEVGITTNGTLLTAELAEQLIDLELDRMVVSIDGVTPEHYQDIRLGSLLPSVMENLRRFKTIKIRRRSYQAKPRVGIAFVAMKRNLEDLPLLPHLARQIGAEEIIVSNVIAHTPEMQAEILYDRAMKQNSRRNTIIDLPRMDFTPDTMSVLGALSGSYMPLGLLGTSLNAHANHCRFVHDNYSVLRWDGVVSPCLAFMHAHDEYYHERKRHVHHYGLGSVDETSFFDIWHSTEYSDFRRRVREFHFSPCTTCTGCELFANGLADCTEANPTPVCGGCLWSQGIVQCP